MEMEIIKRGIFKKSYYVGVTIGNVTRYYYGAAGLVRDMKIMEVDVAIIARLLLKIRRMEYKTLWLDNSFFWLVDWKE